jgi:hypothetical protein
MSRTGNKWGRFLQKQEIDELTKLLVSRVPAPASQTHLPNAEWWRLALALVKEARRSYQSYETRADLIEVDRWLADWPVESGWTFTVTCDILGFVGKTNRDIIERWIRGRQS